MAYTPTVWATGDTITAEKLNKAENGIAAAASAASAAPLIVTVSAVEGGLALDKTFAEIAAADYNVIIIDARENLAAENGSRQKLLLSAEYVEFLTVYIVSIIDFTLVETTLSMSKLEFSAESEDGTLTATITPQ